MNESSSFRILILDDEIYKTIQESEGWDKSHASLESQHCQFVNEFLDANAAVEIILAEDVNGAKLFRLTKNGREIVKEPTNISAWLSQFHVLVLDMNGIGELDNVDGLEDAIVQHLKAIGESVTRESLTELLVKKEVQGVKFYHQHLEHLKSARAIIVLTYQDDTSLGGKKKTPDAIHQLLEAFCKDENHLPASIPWTIKHGKTTGTGERIAHLIHNLHEDFTEGYEMLTNRGQIEFAAVTDNPVLILGESGTGKEYVASAVRRAWEREQNALAKKERGYAVLNCGCITDADAHAELFGAVRGSAASALSHLPGVILQACGCHVLGYEKPDNEYQTRLRAALDKAVEAGNTVESLATVTDPASGFAKAKKVLADLTQLIYPKTDTSKPRQGQADKHNSLPQLIEDVKTHLQNLMDGTDAAAQFKQKLTSHFGTRLVEGRARRDSSVEKSSNPFDLCFTKDAGVLGTLFLDEFADLPPLAQSLLLRFLESGTQEIRPLGYPGRITGVRLRVIAATSDKDVAEMAGVTGKMGLKKRAGDRPRSHPIRYDLVQRLRWHTIRVEPVNEHNIDATITAMIRRAGDLKWDDGAIKVIKAHALKQSETEHFNHRRELRRIIEMTMQHVSKGRQRGLREFAGGKVTREIVGRFLTTPPPTAPHGPDERPSAYESTNAADNSLRAEESKLRETIKTILPDLPEGWKHTQLRDAIKAKSGSVSQIKTLLETAIHLGVAEVGYFGRVCSQPTEKAPRFGIAYAISMGEANWMAVNKQLTAADVKFDPPGKKQETQPPAKAKRGGKK